MKTIQLTDEQYAFLENMAKEMATQSNRMTEFPLFCVYEKKKIFKPEGCGEFRAWTDSCGEPIYEEELNDCTPVFEYLGSHPEDKDMKPEDILTERLSFREVCYDIENFPVSGQVYFTEKAAQHHIDMNHYHYDKPFVYVVSAWRNPEMQMLMQLFSLLAPESKQWRNAYGIDIK